jgi:hypothetical protein
MRTSESRTAITLKNGPFTDRMAHRRSCPQGQIITALREDRVLEVCPPVEVHCVAAVEAHCAAEARCVAAVEAHCAAEARCVAAVEARCVAEERCAAAVVAQTWAHSAPVSVAAPTLGRSNAA